MKTLLNTKCIFTAIFTVFLTITLVLIQGTIHAQYYKLSSENKKAIKNYNIAESYYRAKDFVNAVTNLEKSIKYDPEFIEAWLLLGDSYTEVDSRLDAISAYESAINIDSLFFPSAYYFLGNLNYEIGNYEDAISYYILFSKMPSVSPELLLTTYQQLIFASTANRLLNNPDSTVLVNIGYPINTPGDEYINFVNVNKDYLMLTRRTRLTGDPGNNPSYKEELLQCSKVDSTWFDPVPVSIEWGEDLNMGSLNLSTDGRNMYFTGCYWPEGQGGCDLYMSKKVGEIWNIPTNLGNSINTQNWESQPIISSDNKKLFFASKRSGGKGGSDIWMSVKLKNNRWSPPINLGDSINTPKDEMAPFLHADGNTLFFASTGHPGLGGYDLFISRQDELGRWSLAQNIGYPANSKNNDINIITSVDGSQSLISSDRHGGEGNMDIYIFNNYENILPGKIMYIEGTVVDMFTKKPLEARVQITNLRTSEIINTTISDPITGKFLIVIFPGEDYAFNIMRKGYLFLSENINIEDTVGDESVKKQFELAPFKSGNHLIMNNVFFEFNDYKLLSSSYYELNKLIEILNQFPTSEIIITGHTDSIGSQEYNMELSLNRAKSVFNYLINKGIDKKRVDYSGKGSSQPIEPNNSETGRARNRRTEISVK